MNCFADRWIRRIAAIGLMAIGCVLQSSAVGQEAETPDEAPDAGGAKINAVQADQIVVLKQQLTLSMRPLLQTELDFIRKVCPPAPDRRQKIKAAGDAALDQAAEESAKNQMRMIRGIRIAFGKPLKPEQPAKAKPGPRQAIQEALGKALQESVSAEDFARYQDESTKRSARQKQAAILFLVARMDATLSLTPEQREKISQSIDAKWEDKWQSWMNFNQMALGYMPLIADGLIVPHLTKNQRLVWNQQQKIDMDITNSFDGDEDQDSDGWWGDAP